MTRKELIESLWRLEDAARQEAKASDASALYHMGQQTAFATAIALLECTKWVERTD